MRIENEKGRMNNKTSIGMIALLVSVAMLVTSINACGFFNTASWKEEVLLHDGSKIIVKRWQKLKTVYSLEPSSLINEQSISFKLPGTNKKIVWKDGATKDIWMSVNFKLVALHIKDNIPYLITSPYGCMSFNKWGRPNPAYVIFRYEGEGWKIIEFADLPSEFKTVNLIQSTMSYKHKKEIGFWHRLLTADKIKALNKEGNKLEIYKTIVRTPYKGGGQDGCPEMIYNGSGWMGIDYFNTKATYEECLNECKKILVHPEYCPCGKLFPNNKKGE